jgi:hypothetical protein
MTRALRRVPARGAPILSESAPSRRPIEGGCHDDRKGASKNDALRERPLRLARRRGAATLEFAIVAPIVFLLVLALIQFAGLLMKQNALTAAAREGARIASLHTTVSTDVVVAKVEERLTRGGIDPDVVAVDVNPTTLGSLNTGDAVSVSVSSPMNEMVWIRVVSMPDLNLSANIAYHRE